MIGKRMFLKLIICFIVLLISIPYVIVELHTLLHYSEFDTLYKANGMLDEIEYLKVMKYSTEFAEVYYVSSEKKAAFLYRFTLNDEGDWQLFDWDVVWSTSGSADNLIWPYYR